MLKQKYFLADIFILSAEKQPIKLSWRKIVWLLNEQDEVVYYGITSRTAEKRFAEHLANLEKRGKIARIEILAENLTHDEARSIEGALIRRRITQRLTNEQIRKLSVEEQLKEAGLINKNRGRDPNRWISATPLSTLEEKIYKTPKKICR